MCEINGLESQLTLLVSSPLLTTSVATRTLWWPWRNIWYCKRRTLEERSPPPTIRQGMSWSSADREMYIWPCPREWHADPPPPSPNIKRKTFWFFIKRKTFSFSSKEKHFVFHQKENFLFLIKRKTFWFFIKRKTFWFSIKRKTFWFSIKRKTFSFSSKGKLFGVK